MILVLGLAAAVAAVFVAWIYNRLVSLRNRAAGAWSDIDVQLERRHDLVGNLVEVVRGYSAHERTTLEGVVEARARAEDARGAGRPAEAGSAEGALGARLKSLLAVVEAYPELKASARFLDLQRALVAVEEAIQNARRYYNAVVRDFNTRIQSFPDVLVARPFGFAEREFFELESPQEAAVPRIELP
ncbi:MAG TPA: LemA family protein [Candidatus Polarisedimenticolaceae bacterium]|nr:LemA family protein [Candidatus Polarisedimenticolaceae bacterium]